jgi:peroxiredoxin Q/BCP
VQAHAKFTAKYGLGFPLLSDTSKSVATAYGAWGGKEGARTHGAGHARMSFLLDAAGRIQQIGSTVKPDGHAAEILAALQGG